MPKLSFVPAAPVDDGPAPGAFCGFGVTVNCEVATGICANEPVRFFALTTTTTLNGTIPVA